MKLLITLASIVTFGAMIAIDYPNGAIAAVVSLTISLASVGLIYKFSDDRAFVILTFLSAVSIRLVLGILLEILGLREITGPDATMYDAWGNRIYEYWLGLPIPNDAITYQAFSSLNSSGGMNYLVASIYYVIGRNIFAAQSFCAVVGAATVPLIYFCAKKIYNNINVARWSAIAVAVVPAFVIWSGQLLKDGLIAFLLVLAISMVLILQERLNWFAIITLIAALGGIITLRFYIFYMIAAAVVGSFLIGTETSAQSMLRRVAALIVIGVGLTYVGVIRNAQVDFDRYADLERIQISRQDLSRSAGSGFGEELDVSTTEGALATVPIGLIYLYFAPFPWQFKSAQQLITIPDMLIWWASIPFIIIGLIYTFKNRLRAAISIILFVVMLSLGYSIFQGNVGMIYRQRIQIQVFLFMFAAVGFTVWREKRENREIERKARDKALESMLKANAVR